MRCFICWNCGRLCECNKTFPNGRPKRKSDCADYKDAPPEPKRITYREMANVLGCHLRKIEQLVTSKTGIEFLIKALARKGVVVTYDIKKQKIYFYKEEVKDEK